MWHDTVRPSDRCNGRYRGSDRTGQPQRRRGQEEGMTPGLAQMTGELAQPPQLAEMDTELEDAAFVQRKQAVGAGGLELRIERLDRWVVGDHGHDTARLDPVEQCLVAPVECGTGLMQQRLVRPLLHSHDGIAIAGIKQQEVPTANLDTLIRDRAHQLRVTDQRPAGAEAAYQVNQYAAPLNAGHGHVLDAQAVRMGCAPALRTDDIRPCT